MGWVSSSFLISVRILIVAASLAAGFIPSWALANLPECNTLLIPSKIKVESISVSRVIYSSGVQKLFPKAYLGELTHTIVRQPIYAITEKPGDPVQKGLVAVLRGGNPVPQMTEFHFIETENGGIQIFNIADYSRNRVRWFYETIAKAVLPKEDRFIDILAGYLQGTKILVHPQTIVKLAIKHDVTLANVVMAFSKWTEGPIDTAHYLVKADAPPRNLIRYYFVSRIQDTRLIKVIIDWSVQDGSLTDPGAQITLVSAYPVPEEDLISYQEELSAQLTEADEAKP